MNREEREQPEDNLPYWHNYDEEELCDIGVGIKPVTEKSTRDHYLMLEIVGKPLWGKEQAAVLQGDRAYGRGKLLQLWQKAREKKSTTIELDDPFAVFARFDIRINPFGFIHSFPRAMRRLTIGFDPENTASTYLTVKKREKRVIWIMGDAILQFFIKKYERECHYDPCVERNSTTMKREWNEFALFPKPLLEEGEENMPDFTIWFKDYEDHGEVL